MKDSTPNSSDSSDSLKVVLAEAARQFRRYGYKTVTMDDIARAVGKSKKTLYQLVSTKEELIMMVLRTEIQEEENQVALIARTSENAVQSMLLIGKYFAACLMRSAPVTIYDLQKYYRSGWELVTGNLNTKRLETLRENLQRGQDEGLYRKDLDCDLVASLFLSAATGLMEPDRVAQHFRDWNAVLREFLRYHLHGVCTPQGLALLDEYQHISSFDTES